MGTTAEKLKYLLDTKETIKDAIKIAGASVPDGTTFRGFSALIEGLKHNPQEKTVAPSDEEQIVVPDVGYTGLSKVTVEVDPARQNFERFLNNANGEVVDGNLLQKSSYLLITKQTIKEAIVGKGVGIPEGTTFREYAASINQIKTEFAAQEKTVIPTTQDQTVTPDSGYDGLSAVTVSGDENLVPENIKKDVTIFGVTGTSEASEGSDAGSGTITTNRVSAVSLSESDNSFTITLENGSIILGSAFFDSDGNPTGLTDASGNTVEFSNGYPTCATDIMGNTVPISWG